MREGASDCGIERRAAPYPPDHSCSSHELFHSNVRHSSFVNGKDGRLSIPPLGIRQE